MIENRPKFNGKGSLRDWAVKIALPWLTSKLNLTAATICGSIPESIRRKVISLTAGESLPELIDWNRNGIVISPPGTGKGMAIFVEALAHYERVIVLVPSVIQAHKLEASLDYLYDSKLGGCMTSQRKAKGLIQVVTTGIFHQMVRDQSSDFWKKDTVLIVDEAQRVLEEDSQTEFMVGYMAHMGLPNMIISATIAPGKLPKVFGHGEDDEAVVYELTRQMHPIDIKTVYGDKPDELLVELPVLKTAGETILVFAPSRREIARVVNVVRRNDELDVWAIPVTGAHVVEEQLEAIKKAQATGKPVVVVATPGTMDSSVTISGLSTVVVIDRRIRVDWNEHGVRERWSETLPINHIWQMVRRVGREKRIDGKHDKCFIVSSRSRNDVKIDNPVFESLTGCSPYTPIEDLLLEAVRLNVCFADVHSYMLSTFSDENIENGVKNLLEQGMIQRVDDINDPDGLEFTDKGKMVVNMPYEYRWSRLIVEAPCRIQPWLVLAASFGRLNDLQMFEEKFEIAPHKMSEVIRKINLGVEYINLVHDDNQRIFGQATDLSFRRMEQMETLFDLGCEALGLDGASFELQKSEGKEEECLLTELVVGGLRVGLFDLFFPAKGNQGGWSEPRRTPDLPEGRSRRFFADEGGLDFKGGSLGGVVAVVAEQQWFTARTGAPLGNLDNITIVPDFLVEDLVQQRAENEGWFELIFKVGEFRGRSQMQAEKDGVTYVGSFLDNAPEDDVPYWCSIDRNLGYGRKFVFVHYPVINE